MMRLYLLTSLVGFMLSTSVILATGCALTNETEVLTAIRDGTIKYLCPPGFLRKKKDPNHSCVIIEDPGVAMPYFSNCTHGYICPRCEGGVEIDLMCLPNQLQTCKCKDPKMALSDDGRRCIKLISTTTVQPITQETPEPTTQGVPVPTTQGVPVPTTQGIPVPCLSNPCMNSGICTVEENGFSCECARGWNGTLCEKHVACEYNPCGPNGTCIPLQEFYICNCSTGFYDVTCDIDTPTRTRGSEDCIYNANVILIMSVCCGCLLFLFLTLACVYLFCYCKSGKGVGGGNETKLLGSPPGTPVNRCQHYDNAGVDRKNSNHQQPPQVYPAANPVCQDIQQYFIKSFTTAVVVDLTKKFVEQDVLKAKEFANKFPGGLKDEMYHEIEATSKENVETKLNGLAAKSMLGDMLLVFVLCHGSEEGVKCVDPTTKQDTHLDLEELRKMFYANHCKALEGKPKVFVYTNCRGDLIAVHADGGHGVYVPQVYSAGSAIFATEDATDVLEIYGCGPYQKQYYDDNGPSWLLTELCNVAEDYPKKDLLAILTGVNYNVRKRSGREKTGKNYVVAQQSEFKSTLTRQIYLAPSAGPPDTVSVQDEDNEDDKLDQATGGIDPDDTQHQTQVLLPNSNNGNHNADSLADSEV